MQNVGTIFKGKCQHVAISEPVRVGHFTISSHYFVSATFCLVFKTIFFWQDGRSRGTE